MGGPNVIDSGYRMEHRHADWARRLRRRWAGSEEESGTHEHERTINR